MKFEDLKGILSSNQTGSFPHMSARGNRYIMIVEDSDIGPILATVIKSRKKHIGRIHRNVQHTKKFGTNPILH